MFAVFYYTSPNLHSFGRQQAKLKHPKSTMPGADSTIKIREATLKDLEEIFRIYDAEVLGSTATFDTILKTDHERLEWFQTGRKYPLLIAERDGNNANRILGWSRLYSWSPRPAYDRTAECAVYVDREAQGYGLGTKLMQQLILRAPGIGVKVIISKVSSENQASIKMCEKLGFKTIGVMEKCGEKFGRLLDVTLMDLQLE